MGLRTEIEALIFWLENTDSTIDIDRASRATAQELREILAENPPPTTTIVRIEGSALAQLQQMLNPDPKKRTVHLLRVDQRGDSVAFKVNEGIWSPSLGSPQEPY